MTMVARTRVDSQGSIDAAGRAANHTADDGTQWASCGITFGRATLHSTKNTLGVSPNWDAEDYYRGKRKLRKLWHMFLQFYCWRAKPLYAQKVPEVLPVRRAC